MELFLFPTTLPPTTRFVWHDKSNVHTDSSGACWCGAAAGLVMAILRVARYPCGWSGQKAPSSLSIMECLIKSDFCSTFDQKQQRQKEYYLQFTFRWPDTSYLHTLNARHLCRAARSVPYTPILFSPTLTRNRIYIRLWSGWVTGQSAHRIAWMGWCCPRVSAAHLRGKLNLNRGYLLILPQLPSFPVDDDEYMMMDWWWTDGGCSADIVVGVFWSSRESLLFGQLCCGTSCLITIISVKTWSEAM